MKVRDTLKRVWFSLFSPDRIMLLEYPLRVTSLQTGQNKPSHQKLFNLISENRPIYRQILENTIKYKNVFSTIREDKFLENDCDPGWNNGYLPGLDMVILYSMLAQFNPTTYIEIGSGTSTKVAFKSKRENSLNCEIISIDPAPRRNISQVANKIHSNRIQEEDLKIFETLSENDIVFFDGTHMLLPDSDVTCFFLEILPKLKKGVIVHIHDIYLPYDYPQFMLNRYYNEQYLLAALLLANPDKFEIICPNYFIYCDKELHGLLDPIWQLNNLAGVEQHGGSFWMKIKG
ncbi:MAG TPA: class I SAM-dependent methyltransferase [Chitinophagaceae bacterium]|jgi:hypothetical protein